MRVHGLLRVIDLPLRVLHGLRLRLHVLLSGLRIGLGLLQRALRRRHRTVGGSHTVRPVLHILPGTVDGTRLAGLTSVGRRPTLPVLRILPVGLGLPIRSTAVLLDPVGAVGGGLTAVLVRLRTTLLLLRPTGILTSLGPRRLRRIIRSLRIVTLDRGLRHLRSRRLRSLLRLRLSLLLRLKLRGRISRLPLRLLLRRLRGILTSLRLPGILRLRLRVGIRLRLHARGILLGLFGGALRHRNDIPVLRLRAFGGHFVRERRVGYHAAAEDRGRTQCRRRDSLPAVVPVLLFPDIPVRVACLGSVVLAHSCSSMNSCVRVTHYILFKRPFKIGVPDPRTVPLLPVAGPASPSLRWRVVDLVPAPPGFPWSLPALRAPALAIAAATSRRSTFPRRVPRRLRCVDRDPDHSRSQSFGIRPASDPPFAPKRTCRALRHCAPVVCSCPECAGIRSTAPLHLPCF